MALEQLQTRFVEKLQSVKNLPEKASLFEPIFYVINNPGKRIRPQIVLTTTQIFGGSLEDALDPALAVECIHLYSCIHDDLPCMDDDDFRRNQPSLHKAYGESLALLTGDFFLTFAFQLLAECSLSAEKKSSLISVLSQKSGALGMIAGQTMDIQSDNLSIKEEEILFMHERKTAALLEAAALFGAIIGSSTQEEKKRIESFARALGVGYQITDDVLDQTGKFSTLGKPIGSDEKNAKATSVCMYGLAKAQEKASFWYDEALESLNKIEKNTDALKDLTRCLIKRNF